MRTWRGVSGNPVEDVRGGPDPEQLQHVLQLLFLATGRPERLAFYNEQGDQTRLLKKSPKM
jgi:hypothetical protein